MTRFSDQDLQRIRAAVQAAERKTRGEIVPMVVPASARYREAAFRTGLILGLLTLAGLVTAEAYWLPWGWHAGNAGWLLLAVLLAYGIGQWLGACPSVVRLVTSRERMAFKVRRRAELAFYEHGLHKTQEGTGILIMVSLLERRVQVLADRAINERVPPGTWDALTQELIQGIKDGRPTEALCQAIARCGDLLADYFPARPGDNPDELGDELVQEP